MSRAVEQRQQVVLARSQAKGGRRFVSRSKETPQRHAQRGNGFELLGGWPPTVDRGFVFRTIRYTNHP